MNSLVMCSDWSRNMFPKNQGGHFTNRLHATANFSDENSYVALGDVVHSRDSFQNVRENFNDVEIRMKGFTVWGIKEYTVHLNDQPYIRVKNLKVQYDITRLDADKKCGSSFPASKWLYGTSEWASINADGSYPIPVFKNLPENFDTTWVKNDCNEYKFKIQHPGPVKEPSGEWFTKTVFVTPNRYANFQDFSFDFAAVIDEGIQQILKENNAHPVLTKIPRYTKENHVGYDMNIFQRFHKLRRYYVYLDKAYDEDSAFIMKMMYGGGASYGLYDDISTTFRSAHQIAQLFIVNTDMFYENVKNMDLGDGPEMGYFIRMENIHDKWLALTTYNIFGTNENVAALILNEEFFKDTQFSIKINRYMQYQMGFTNNPLYDLGWINWYPRKVEIETNKIASVFWFGHLVPDLTRNPPKSLYIYCDIIENSQVGSKKLQLLRILPVNSSTALVAHESFAALQYRRINKNNVATISIRITETPFGNPMRIGPPVYVKLLFHKYG